MMKHKAPLIVSAVLLGQMLPAQAEQTSGETLVGNAYGGIHGSYLQADNDRLDGDLTRDEFAGAGGYGAELGYRITRPVELRLSYTRFEADIDNGPNVQGINQYNLDALYFPNEDSFYVLGGLNALDFDTDTEAALNVGLGYRQYFTDRFAAYGEVKGNYQFNEKYTDAIAQIGLIYYFSKNDAPVEPVVVYAAPVDTDQDGVVNGTDECANTPMSDKVDAVGCTIFEEEKLSTRLLVNFDNNKSEVKPEYYSEVEKTADFLKTYPQVNITVDGHSSAVGAADYNKELSQKRADAVADLLVSEYGIDASRITAVGHGEEELLDTANTAEANEMNRRIEINIEETREVPVER